VLAITGRLRVEVRDASGVLVGAREVPNTVVRSGAELLAALFTGKTATPLNGFGVGTNGQPTSAPYEVPSLAAFDEAGQPLVGPVAAPIAPDAFTVETVAAEQRVRIRARSVLPPQAANAADGRDVAIAEAALGVLDGTGAKLAAIYNRVVFEPIPKAREHELVLYWEISFPYGISS